MRVFIFFTLAMFLVAGVLLLLKRGASISPVMANGSGFRHPDIEYFKVINSVAPPQDPQILFLLMGQYSNANLQKEGAEFFSARLKEFGPRLTDAQKSLYLSAIGLLRAQNAPSVSLLHRMGYVKDTIAILEQARKLSGGQIFVVNWIAGIVYTELPKFFGQQTAAQDELTWCLQNADKAPNPGWLREVDYHLGKIALAKGEADKAQDYLVRSGYKNFSSPIALNTPFSEDVMTGHSFVSRRIGEIVPGRVYALSGYEFTEYYFVVSDDRRELIGIDAGTRPDSAKAAYRGTASVCAEFAGTDHHLCNPLPLGPHRRTQLLPVRESSHSFLCPEQLSGRDSGRAKRTGDFWRAISLANSSTSKTFVASSPISQSIAGPS